MPTPRIAIAGIAIESSTFSPHRAGDRDFRKVTGVELVNRYEACAEGGADWVGVFYARSIPGGAVQREVYEDYRERICAGLRQVMAEGPLDGLFFDIHGAMSVEGMKDAEGDLITAIRDVIGPDVMVSSSMDLHGNISPTLIENIDLITCYRMAPHEDAWETKNRAARNLVQVLNSEQRPVRAWVPVPILLPGEKTSTRVDPAKGLYARIPEIEGRPGIIDAAIWVGYAWADEPRCHASIVVQGTDEEACTGAARELAEAMWAVRDDFEFVGPPGTLDEAVTSALEAVAEGATPYLISDSGDNPGAGGTGDVTWTLTELLARPELTSPEAPVTLVGSIFDPEALDKLCRATVGGPVDVEVGARTAPSPAPPVQIRGTLHSLHEGDADAGGIAVIAVGNLHAIVTEHRKAFHSTEDYSALGLDPYRADIIVTEIGHLEPTLYEIARGWPLALTPGGVDQELGRLGHSSIQRPMVPFDDSDFAPNLTPQVYRGPARP